MKAFSSFVDSSATFTTRISFSFSSSIISFTSSTRDSRSSSSTSSSSTSSPSILSTAVFPSFPGLAAAEVAVEVAAGAAGGGAIRASSVFLSMRYGDPRPSFLSFSPILGTSTFRIRISSTRSLSTFFGILFIEVIPRDSASASNCFNLIDAFFASTIICTSFAVRSVFSGIFTAAFLTTFAGLEIFFAAAFLTGAFFATGFLATAFFAVLLFLSARVTATYHPLVF